MIVEHQQNTLLVQEDTLSGSARLKEVLEALSTLRTSIIKEEFYLQQKIAEIFKAKNIPFQKEYKLAPRNRIDFLVESGIGIEVKKGKPNRGLVVEQLHRYCTFSEISTIILVIERNLDIPSEIEGKKCISFGLNKLWGVALR